jgi:hypothetical protein
MAHVIVGTWEEIKSHDAELTGRQVRLIVDAEPDDILAGLPDPPHTVRDCDHLIQLLRERLQSGPGVEATPEFWREKEAELLDRQADLASSPDLV